MPSARRLSAHLAGPPGGLHSDVHNSPSSPAAERTPNGSEFLAQVIGSRSSSFLYYLGHTLQTRPFFGATLPVPSPSSEKAWLEEN